MTFLLRFNIIINPVVMIISKFRKKTSIPTVQDWCGELNFIYKMENLTMSLHN